MTMHPSRAAALFLLIGFLYQAGAPAALYAQAQQHTTAITWFGLLELPFLVLCVFFAFLTAHALKGGIFGRGMNLLAWGFLVMAVGHLHMQVEHYTGYSLFNRLLGESGGSVVWLLALAVTWGLSSSAFYQIYRASKSP